MSKNGDKNIIQHIVKKQLQKISSKYIVQYTVKKYLQEMLRGLLPIWISRISTFPASFWKLKKMSVVHPFCAGILQWRFHQNVSLCAGSPLPMELKEQSLALKNSASHLLVLQGPQQIPALQKHKAYAGVLQTRSHYNAPLCTGSPLPPEIRERSLALLTTATVDVSPCEQHRHITNTTQTLHTLKHQSCVIL